MASTVPTTPIGWTAAVEAYHQATDGVSAVSGAPDEVIDTAVNKATDALKAMLATKAPNANAIRFKLKCIQKEGFEAEAETWAALDADLESLEPKSLILDLHARYERSLADFDKIDEARTLLTRAGEVGGTEFLYEKAMNAMLAEREALVLSILYQVPSTDEELTIIAEHLWATYDVDSTDTPAAELAAIAIALENVFDYLVGEGRASMEKIGPSFQRNAMLAWNHRRAREGHLEGEA